MHPSVTTESRGVRLFRLLSLSIAIASLALFVLVIPSTATNNSDGAVVSMQLTKRDFGDVFSGEELEQNFPIQNTGTKPLELSQKSTLSLNEGSPKRVPSYAVFHSRDERLINRVGAAPPAPT